LISGKSYNRSKVVENITGLLMVLPTVIIFLIFLYFPFFNAIRISFYEYSGIGPIVDFVGLRNYRQAIVDPNYYNALGNILKLMVIDVTVSISVGFILAYILFERVPGWRFFSSSLFIPYLISMVVSGSIWTIIYDPTIGPVNAILKMMGMGNLARAWLGDPGTAMYCVAVTWIWRVIPFNMLIMYANILKMPIDFLEAAKIDGATLVQRIRYVIIPYLKPTFGVLFLLTVTHDFRIFDTVWIMTQGGPARATEAITTYIYRKAFQNLEFGYASAISIIMMIMMFAVVAIVNIIRDRAKD